MSFCGALEGAAAFTMGPGGKCSEEKSLWSTQNDERLKEN